jgi:polycystin 2
LIIEFPATGGMLTTWSIETSKLIRFISTYDYVVFAFEIIFALFILYYAVEEVLDVSQENKIFKY